MLRVTFTPALQETRATFEVPFAGLERPADGTEVPAQRWADLSDGQYGVSLINDCKYGYDIHGHTMRLTLLRSSTYPDPSADKGFHHYKYSLYPHAGDFQEAGVVRKSLEFNEPMQVVRTQAHPGALGKSHAFVEVESDHVILNALKKAEAGTSWILRFYETAGQEGSVKVVLDRRINRVQEVNLIEDPLQPVQSIGNAFVYQIKPNEIRTFQVDLR